MNIIKYLRKLPIQYKLLIIFLLVLALKNNFSIYLLKKYGQEKIVKIEKVNVVGSKGTVRAFYKFNIKGNDYEGFYDNDGLKKSDSLLIVYFPNYPSLNQSKKFIEDY
jgi:hypothetical protein